MSNPIKRLEAGDTKLFTITYSSAPSTPYLAIYVGSDNTTLVRCLTATASSSTQFYAFVTLPQTRQIMVFEWVGSFTNGPVITRETFQVIKHTA